MDASLILPHGGECAPAKVNLALHVRARQADGYHRLETLFAFTHFADTLEADDAADWSLAVDGPAADAAGPVADNLVLRAARAFATATGSRQRFAFRLVKRIPVAAGLGGGSADAAAALRLLNRRAGQPLDQAALEAIGAELGADVPACIASRTVWGTGRGEILRPGPDLAGQPILLANPCAAVPTAPVFAGWDGVDRGPLEEDWRAGRNDLQAPAITHAPAIAETLGWLAALPGATLTRMSGSGATCFALFDTPPPDTPPPHGWWQQATVLR